MLVRVHLVHLVLVSYHANSPCKVLEKVLGFLALGFLGLLQMKQRLLTRSSELKLSCHCELVETVGSRRDSWMGEINGGDGAPAMAAREESEVGEAWESRQCVV